MAYQARDHFPDQTIHITNEIIHNPQVNDRYGTLYTHPCLVWQLLLTVYNTWIHALPSFMSYCTHTPLTTSHYLTNLYIL